MSSYVIRSSPGDTTWFRAAEVSFSVPGGRVNVDGEILDMPEVRARILPGALLVCR